MVDCTVPLTSSCCRPVVPSAVDALARMPAVLNWNTPDVLVPVVASVCSFCSAAAEVSTNWPFCTDPVPSSALKAVASGADRTTEDTDPRPAVVSVSTPFETEPLATNAW